MRNHHREAWIEMHESELDWEGSGSHGIDFFAGVSLVFVVALLLAGWLGMIQKDGWRGFWGPLVLIGGYIGAIVAFTYAMMGVEAIFGKGASVTAAVLLAITLYFASKRC